MGTIPPNPWGLVEQSEIELLRKENATLKQKLEKAEVEMKSMQTLLDYYKTKEERAYLERSWKDPYWEPGY